MKEQLLSVGIDIGTSSAEVNSACGNAVGILRLAPSHAVGPIMVEVPR